MVKTFLLALLLGATASAQISNVDRAIVERGRNLLTNGGFESGRASWTASGGTFTTITSSEVGMGSVSGTWDSSASAQTLRTALVTIPEGLKGVNGEFSCRIRVPSGTATHTIEVNDGTNIISRVNVTSSTQYLRSGDNFLFPSSGQIRLEIDSVASNEPLIQIDDCYLGTATNIGSVAQATLYATAKQFGSSSAGQCNYVENTSTSLTNYVDLGVAGTCTQPWTTVGNISISATTDYKPTLTNIPPGRYKVSVFGVFYGSTTGTCWYRMTDGTTNGGWSHSSGAPNSTFSTMQSLTGYFDYSTAQSSVQFKVQAADDHAGNCGLFNEAQSDRQLYWIVERFPTSSETVVRSENAWWKVDANISGANPSLGTVAVTSYTGIENGSLTLTNNSGTGNVTAQIPCSSTNAPTGTTCSVGNESVGVSFTPVGSFPQDVLACVSFTSGQDIGAGGSINTTFQVVETAINAQTIIQEGKSRIYSRNGSPSTSAAAPLRVCGTFTFTSGGQKALRLMYEQEVSGTITSSVVVGDASSSRGQSDIHWEVYPLNVARPATTFAGSVTSNSSGLERVERVTVSNPGTPTTSSQSGSWVSGYVDNGVGDITVNFAAGIFSNTPTCVSNTAANANITCTAHGASSANVSVVCRTANTAAVADSSFNLVCMGPR